MHPIAPRCAFDVRLAVRRAVLGDEPLLRTLRLEALSLAAEAFGSTYEREVGRTMSDWQQWLSPGATFVVEDDEDARGMVAGVRDVGNPAVVHLMAMWVCPQARGSGAADALIAAVLAWAASEGATLVHLNVIKENERARRAYERNGFRLSGEESIRARDGRVEVQMTRRAEVTLHE